MIHPFFFYVTRKMDCSQFIHSCVCRDPHSRGVYACHNHSVSLQGRFIPTRVGYTLKEHIDSVYSNGSSPLAWGIQADIPLSGCSWRFIPTRVGYTYIVRGSQKKKIRFIPTRVGYTPATPSSKAQYCRFIPTRVGYTVPTSAYASSNSVHPHSRGVYIKISAFRTFSTGSSPLAWGIRGKKT